MRPSPGPLGHPLPARGERELSFLRRGHIHDRQRKEKRRPRALLALDPDRATVALHDLLGDVEAEAETAVIRRRHLASAVEALEDLPDLVGGDADAAVAHRGHELIAAVLEAHVDVAAVRGVLLRVLEQIAEHLLEAVAVARDLLIRLRERDVKLAVAAGGGGADGLPHQTRPAGRLPGGSPSGRLAWLA